LRDKKLVTRTDGGSGKGVAERGGWEKAWRSWGSKVVLGLLIAGFIAFLTLFIIMMINFNGNVVTPSGQDLAWVPDGTL